MRSRLVCMPCGHIWWVNKKAVYSRGEFAWVKVVGSVKRCPECKSTNLRILKVEEMQRVGASGSVVKGLDVSHYDETIDFAKVKAAGYEFCWAKCTEGVANRDPNYKTNKQKAKAAGLLFGAYHFFRPALDPLKQAAWFLQNANLEKGDFQPMFDWEVSHDKHFDAQKAMQWLTVVERSCGVKPIIYGPPYLLNDFGLPLAFANYPLCVAHYGTLQPLVPAPWKVWSFHQFTDKGAVPGIPAPDEDLDRFNGSLENLKKFVL